MLIQASIATTENTIKLFDRSCSQKVISIWQDVWSIGKIAMHRSGKHAGNFLKKKKHYDGCSIRVVDCSIRVFRFLAAFRLTHQKYNFNPPLVILSKD